MKYVVKRRTVYADGRFNVDDTQPVGDFTTLKEAQRFMRKHLLDVAVLCYLARHEEQFKDCMSFEDVKDTFKTGMQLLEYLQSKNLIDVTVDRIKCTLALKVPSGGVTSDRIELEIY